MVHHGIIHVVHHGVTQHHDEAFQHITHLSGLKETRASTHTHTHQFALGAIKPLYVTLTCFIHDLHTYLKQ